MHRCINTGCTSKQMGRPSRAPQHLLAVTISPRTACHKLQRLHYGALPPTRHKSPASREVRPGAKSCGGLGGEEGAGQGFEGTHQQRVLSHLALLQQRQQRRHLRGT